MNTWAFDLLKMKRLIILIIPFLVSCEEPGNVLFGVEDVTIKQEGIEKPNIKTNIEFISIAYSDLIGKSITSDELVELAVSYESFGDFKAIEDLIIRNFLNRPDALIPKEVEMRANVNKFVIDTYRKFFNRDPNEFEQWFLTTEIEKNQDITPEVVYYGIMTSNEYRNF